MKPARTIEDFLAPNGDGAYTLLMRGSLKSSAVFSISLLVASSCAHHPQQPLSSGSIRPLALESGPNVIGHLEHRNGTVTVKSGADGAILYSGKSKEDKMLFENLTAEQLRVQSPEMYDFLQAYEKAGASDINSFAPAPVAIQRK